MPLHVVFLLVLCGFLFPAQAQNSTAHTLEQSSLRYFKSHPVSDTWITVSKSALIHNITRIKQMSGTRKICAVVKADAYGHGIDLVAPVLAPYADAFCVTDNIEIARIRKLGLKNPIIRIRLGTESERKEALQKKWHVQEWIGTLEMAENHAYWAKKFATRALVHIELDSTHMGRSGFPMNGSLKERSLQDIEHIASLKPLKIEGLSAHFPLSENNNPQKTLESAQQFIQDASQVHAILSKYKHNPLWHINNSAGSQRLPEELQKFFHLNRVGVSLYGQNAYSGEPMDGWKDAMHVYSHVSAVHERLQGDTIGYDSIYTVEKPHLRTANIPVGWYVLPRHLNKTSFYITNNKGDRFKILGKISANTMVVEAENDSGALLKTGDLVHIMGTPALSQNDIASLLETDAMYVSVYMGKSHEAKFLVE